MSHEGAEYPAAVATAFHADLRLLSAAEGGRETPLRSGYRSIVRFGEVDSEAWGVEITFDTQAELAPGESALVHMRSWADPPFPATGTAIRLYEGQQVVGIGTVRDSRRGGPACGNVTRRIE
jgi:translation elongation factor EF-Tu-like GTPase